MRWSAGEPAAVHTLRVILLLNVARRDPVHVRHCRAIPTGRVFIEVGDGVGPY